MIRRWVCRCVAVLSALCILSARAETPNDAALHEVFMLDASHAWAVGDFGTILVTSDGGETWTPQQSGSNAILNAVHFVDADHGFAVGGAARPDGRGGYGVLLATPDGGKTWNTVHEGRTGWLRDVWFENARRGWVVGDATATVPTGVLYTVNGAPRLRPLPGEPSAPLFAAAFNRFAKGVAVGKAGTVVTLRGVDVADFGSNVTFAGTLRGAAFGSRTNACLVGDNATIFTSNDGGRDWRLAPPPFATALRDVVDLRGVCFSDAEQGWAVGSSGAHILHSADAGATWSVRTIAPSSASFGLRGVHFTDAKHGLAVGDLGRIWKTADGGETWRVVRNESFAIAALVVTGGSSRTAWPVLAHLYGSNGWRCGLLRASGTDDLHAFRTSGLAVGCPLVDALTDFPSYPSPTESTTKQTVLDFWSERLDRDAAQSLRLQLVAAIRAIRPAVVLVDASTIDTGPHVESAVIAEATIDAARMAADPAAFPKLRTIGLTEHTVSRVWEGAAANHAFVPIGQGRDKKRKAPPAGTCRVPLLTRYWPRLSETSYFAALPALACSPVFEPDARPPIALRFQVARRGHHETIAIAQRARFAREIPAIARLGVCDTPGRDPPFPARRATGAGCGAAHGSQSHRCRAPARTGHEDGARSSVLNRRR